MRRCICNREAREGREEKFADATNRQPRLAQPLDCGGSTPLFHRRGFDAQSPRSFRQQVAAQFFRSVQLENCPPFPRKAKAESSLRTPKPRGTQGAALPSFTGLEWHHFNLDRVSWRQPLDCGGSTPLFHPPQERRAESLLPPQQDGASFLRSAHSVICTRVPRRAKAVSSHRTPKPRGTSHAALLFLAK